MSIKHLAKSLGLSTATVSRALNGFPEINSKTRERVMAEAKRQGYQANPLARRLVLGRSDTVGWVFPSDSNLMSDEQFLGTIEGLTETVNKSKIDFHIVPASAFAELQTYEHLVKAKILDALVVSRTKVEDSRIRFLHSAGFPFISYGRTQNTDMDHSWLDIDNEQASRIAVDHLVQLGHQHIAYFHEDLGFNFAYQRHQGFLRAMESHGLAIQSKWIRFAGYSRRSGHDTALALLQGKGAGHRPTAIIVDGSWSGVGVLRSLLDKGLKLGQDIAIVVYGGIPEDALFSTDQVGVVEFENARRVGEQLGKMLLELLQTNMTQPAVQQILWQPRLRV